MTINNQIDLMKAAENLPQLCDQVVEDRDIVIITRSDGENVALIAADELNSMIESLYLLRSPKNAERLLTAIEEVKSKIKIPQTLRELSHELGVEV